MVTSCICHILVVLVIYIMTASCPVLRCSGQKVIAVFMSYLLSWMMGAGRFITVPIMHRSAQAFRFRKGKSDLAEKSNHRMSKKMFICMLV